MARTYSLRKSRHILQTCFKWYQKKGHTLSPDKLSALEYDLHELDEALLEGDRESADKLAKKVEAFSEIHCKKGILAYTWELAIALIFALIIATVVRQMWFELYEIPTGSMRPTFKEQDHLTVTKTAFGINVPMETKHFYFNPDLVQRASVVIFSGDGLPLRDTETTYFWVLPYTKRYIKRLLGKPGDSFYFYGGKIYSVDKEGNALEELLDSPWMKDLEHIPFLNFRGEVAAANGEQLYFYQMHKPIGRTLFSKFSPPVGEIFNGKEWIRDNPNAQQKPHSAIQTYSDILGMRNFAMARLLTKKELQERNRLQSDNSAIPDAPLYLELSHTPTLAALPLQNYNSPLFTFKTIIPLEQRHLDAIMQNMYTSRFYVKDGKAARYSPEKPRFNRDNPAFPGVPDGCYELYYGKAYEIGFGGIAHLLPKSHPLYSNTPENIQRLFNFGIEISSAFAPTAKNENLFPNRYAYFRDGALYLLGAEIYAKDDPILIEFNKREREREAASSTANPYVGFKDYGPPLKDGKYDIDFIRTFGMTLPEKNYLVLGDNHALSADSRVFGYVPQENLQGAPSLILWPPGSRWGIPMQKPYPLITTPRLIVWGILAAILTIWYLIHRRNIRRPIFKKIQK